MFFSFSVTVVDSDGVSAPAMDIIMIMCSSCSHHGVCNYNRTRDASNSTFRLARCICDQGYTGKHMKKKILFKDTKNLASWNEANK